MRLELIAAAIVFLPACIGPRGPAPTQARQPQAIYRQPAFMQPELTQRMPPDDLCRSRLFLGLVGQHEGGVVFSSLPGRTRVVKPAELEMEQDEFLQDMNPDPPYVEIREYLAGQILYSPAISAVRVGDNLGPIEQDRLTIELDQYGYIRELSCR